MSGSGLRIGATVRMLQQSGLPITKALSAGWGVSISHQGKLFPGRVLECEKPIAPGEVGEAIIDIMFLTSLPQEVDIRVGSTFELLAGPNPIASATVINLIETTDREP